MYSALAIQTCLTLKTLFGLPYRATEGLMKSLMRLNGLDLPVPDHTHLSRRAAQLAVKIPRRPRKGSIHVVGDSTGLKIFGEGEWKVRQHGVDKRRTWHVIHLAVDATEKDIIGIEVTTADWAVSEVFPDLLVQVDGEVAQVSAHGAYDTVGCHRSIAENVMLRPKQRGDRMFSRTFERQVAKAHVCVAILNRFTYLGMPQSVRAGHIVPTA